MIPGNSVISCTRDQEIGLSLPKFLMHCMLKNRIRPRSDLLPVPGHGAWALTEMDVVQTRQCPEQKLLMNN